MVHSHNSPPPLLKLLQADKKAEQKHSTNLMWPGQSRALVPASCWVQLQWAFYSFILKCCTHAFLTPQVPPFDMFVLIPRNIRLMRTGVLGFMSATPTAFQELADETFGLIKSGKLKVEVHHEC